MLDRLRALLSSRTDVSETLAPLDLNAYALDDATPTRRAISRVEIPALFNLRHSRTWRIDILSIGIGDPPSQSRKSGP